LAGALLGARILTRTNTDRLRQIFTAILVVSALQMLYKGLRGSV
jgi:uncharacterized membrane protein YfcA